MKTLASQSSHRSLFGLLAAAFLSVTPLAFANYQLDDGIPGPTGVKIGAPGVLVNQFTAVSGELTITGIELVFDTLDPLAAGAPLNLLVYSDPNNDGLFNDAVLIHSQPGFLPEVLSSAPVTYSFVSGITFNPGDVFYVGYEEFADSKISISRDTAGGTRSWASFGGINPVNPTQATTVASFASFGSPFAQDAMIRAVSTAAVPEPASSAALAGAILLGGAALRRGKRA